MNIDFARIEKLWETDKSFYCLECHRRHFKTSRRGLLHYGKRWVPSDEAIVAKLRAKSHDGKMLLSEAVKLVGESTVKRLSKANVMEKGRTYCWFIIRRTRGGAYLELY